MVAVWQKSWCITVELFMVMVEVVRESGVQQSWWWFLYILEIPESTMQEFDPD